MTKVLEGPLRRCDGSLKTDMPMLLRYWNRSLPPEASRLSYLNRIVRPCFKASLKPTGANM